jgi:glycosyltransferase involved in cell wall biosynthesis
MKKIVIVTDAWHPQINGVVTTLSQTVSGLCALGHRVSVISPLEFRSLPCPSYPEISLAFATPRAVEEKLRFFAPDCVHIATEGPLGWAARRVCIKRQFPFSSSYHTRFPEYVRMRWPVSIDILYAIVRRFHSAATRTMVATNTLKQELSGKGFKNLVQWSRGVNTELFKPAAAKKPGVVGPVFIYLGRVAVEKNIEAFLRLNLPGTKCVVGDGPALSLLKERYPEVHFTGFKKGVELADLLAGADVFVFPSLTDTFGVVLLEAMASGLPVAAFPVTGPLETVVNGVNGYLDHDLQKAALKALTISPEKCREYALGKTWDACTRQFLDNLVTAPRPLF